MPRIAFIHCEETPDLGRIGIGNFDYRHHRPLRLIHDSLVQVDRQIVHHSYATLSPTTLKMTLPLPGLLTTTASCSFSAVIFGNFFL